MVEYGFDIANIIIELQKQLDDLRKQSHQIKLTERQNALALKLEGAEATVQRGKEQFAKELGSAIAGIVSGAITVIGTGVTLGLAVSRGKVDSPKGEMSPEKFEETLATNAKEAAQRFRDTIELGTPLVNGVSGLAKNMGDAIVSTKNQTIAEQEARGQRLSAFADNADRRQQAALDQANELNQLITKLTDSMAQMQRALNDANSAASRV